MLIKSFKKKFADISASIGNIVSSLSQKLDSSAFNKSNIDAMNINAHKLSGIRSYQFVQKDLSGIGTINTPVAGDYDSLALKNGIYRYTPVSTGTLPNGYGSLLVITSGLWVRQVAYGTDGETYSRMSINSGVWSDWKKFSFLEEESVTVSLAGRGDFTGGTIRFVKQSNLVTAQWWGVTISSAGDYVANVVPVGFRTVHPVSCTLFPVASVIQTMRFDDSNGGAISAGSTRTDTFASVSWSNIEDGSVSYFVA